MAVILVCGKTVRLWRLERAMQEDVKRECIWYNTCIYFERNGDDNKCICSKCMMRIRIV